jgi:hypothetical protein
MKGFTDEAPTAMKERAEELTAPMSSAADRRQ